MFTDFRTILSKSSPFLLYLDPVWSIYSRIARILLDEFSLSNFTLTLNGKDTPIPILYFPYLNWSWSNETLLRWWAREHLPCPIGTGFLDNHSRILQQIHCSGGPTLPISQFYTPYAELGGKYRSHLVLVEDGRIIKQFFNVGSYLWNEEKDSWDPSYGVELLGKVIKKAAEDYHLLRDSKPHRLSLLS